MSEPDPNATSASTTDSTLAAIEGAQGPRLNVLVAGDSVFSTHALPSVGTATLGRSADNDVAIDNASISRVHARIHVGVPLRIEDAGSANGTWIRGRRLEPGEIVNLDVNEAFRLGPVTLIIQPRAAKLVTRRIRSHDYFENRVEEECSRAARTKRPVVVLQVVVDQAQRTAAQPHVGSALRESDVFAEYVPGTFEVLLLDADPAQVDVVTDRMRDTLAAAQIPARVARGIYPTDGRDAVALLRHVRAALQGDGGDGEVMQGEAGGIIVADDKMRAIHALVSRVARGDINVLLLGETGAGKEVVAEAVHRQSKRAGKPFLRLNCAAFTETLLESELFGHERGAFTGAHAAKQGLFEVAAGGTVFLDEVGELTPATQSKLLRVLDDRKVIRVGGVRPISLDVRIVSATNRDLDREAERGTFRLDLLYRLNAISILLPPLRERVAEIDPLARHFMRRYADARGIPVPTLSEGAIARLRQYSWPGNIRELRNIIERALILCDGVSLTESDLPLERMAATFTVAPRPMGPAAAAATPARTGVGEPPALGGPTGTGGLGSPAPPWPAAAGSVRVPRGGDRAAVVAALEACAGNQSAAAKRLGVSRRTLVNWIEKLDLPRPRKSGSSAG
jgi:two-component system response regulator AtoC